MNYVLKTCAIYRISYSYVLSTSNYVLCLEIERFFRGKFVESYDWEE